MQLVLGSSSPYRRKQLQSLGYEFEISKPEIDETPGPGETAPALVTRLAHEKAQAVAALYPQAAVIGADQVALCGSQILGKPGTPERAIAQLLELSGSSVTFLSAVCVIAPGHSLAHTEPTDIDFRDLTRTEIERYVTLDDPLDCAGAIRSESRGPHLFDRVQSNDPTALLGLPLIRLAAMLRTVGLNPLT